MKICFEDGPPRLGVQKETKTKGNVSLFCEYLLFKAPLRRKTCLIVEVSALSISIKF